MSFTLWEIINLLIVCLYLHLTQGFLSLSAEENYSSLISLVILAFPHHHLCRAENRCGVPISSQGYWEEEFWFFLFMPHFHGVLIVCMNILQHGRGSVTYYRHHTAYFHPVFSLCATLKNATCTFRFHCYHFSSNFILCNTVRFYNVLAFYQQILKNEKLL